MSATVIVELTEEEAKMVVAALNSVPVQGVQAMQKVLALVLKIQQAETWRAKSLHADDEKTGNANVP
jgi:hypothetical protein